MSNLIIWVDQNRNYTRHMWNTTSKPGLKFLCAWLRTFSGCPESRITTNFENIVIHLKDISVQVNRAKSQYFKNDIQFYKWHSINPICLTRRWKINPFYSVSGSTENSNWYFFLLESALLGFVPKVEMPKFWKISCSIWRISRSKTPTELKSRHAETEQNGAPSSSSPVLGTSGHFYIRAGVSISWKDDR